MIERAERGTELEPIEIDGAVGVIFPEALLERLGLREGDTLSAAETPGGLRLSVGDPEHEAGMGGRHRGGPGALGGAGAVARPARFTGVVAGGGAQGRAGDGRPRPDAGPGGAAAVLDAAAGTLREAATEGRLSARSRIAAIPPADPKEWRAAFRDAVAAAAKRGGAGSGEAQARGRDAAERAYQRERQASVVSAVPPSAGRARPGCRAHR